MKPYQSTRDDISLCKLMARKASCKTTHKVTPGSEIYYLATLNMSEGGMSGHSQSLYFHHNPSSDEPGDFWGFFSISAGPTCQASRDAIKEQGWETSYKNMSVTLPS